MSIEVGTLGLDCGVLATATDPFKLTRLWLLAVYSTTEWRLDNAGTDQMAVSNAAVKAYSLN